LIVNSIETQTKLIRITTNELDLVVDLFDKYRVFYKQPSDIARAVKFLSERLLNNESIIVAAVEEQVDGIVTSKGFTQLYPKYSSARTVKNWILNDLYVDAPYRKQGIGKMLIDYAMNFARDNGSEFVQLETAFDNYTAQGLYESIGFVRQAPSEDFLLYKITVN
jgi:ribosomal protein S18 acetylase RimI-like enzyme